MRYRLSSTDPDKWELMNLPNWSFKSFCFGEALVVENKIVYFGNLNQEVTLVLEEESEKLKVVRKDDGLNPWRG